MRIGTVLMALGSTFSGFLASPAATPRVSMPPKENVTMVSAVSTPRMPCGRNPPWSTRFARLAWVPSAVEAPVKSRITPPKIIATMAPTFTSVSQNSASPKFPTCVKLIRPTTRIVAATQAQAGTPGNQNAMYAVMAAVSATITTASSKTKVQPVT